MHFATGLSKLFLVTQINQMIISGFFQFLHSINVAWLLSAKNVARSNMEQLTVNILPDHSLSLDQDTRKYYLESFQFADKVTSQPRSNVSRNAVPIPKNTREVNLLLDNWIEPRLNNVIFEADGQPDKLLQKFQKQKVISTNGCYDILHPGHLATLKFAKSLGDCLVVMINSDESVKRFKGDSRPIHNHFFRAAILTQLPWVDYVIIFKEDTPLDLMENIRPSGHVKGGSFIQSRVAAEVQLLDKWGGKFHVCPMIGTFSTSNLLDNHPKLPFPI